MQNKRSQLLYNFNQGISDRFISIDLLLRHALPILENYVGADRILFFDWREDKSVISLRTLCQDGKCYDLQEDVFVDRYSPEVIKLLEDGYMPSPGLDYPAVYVLVKWRSPQCSLEALTSGKRERSRCGVIRVERHKGNKAFTQSEIDSLIALCRELSAKINMTEIDHYNTSQLQRAQALNDLARVFATSIRLSDSLIEILKSIQKCFFFDRTSLYLVNPENNELQEAYSADLSGEVKQIEIDENLFKNFTSYCDYGISVCPAVRNSDIVLTLPLTLQSKNLGWLVFDNMLSRLPIAKEDILSLRQFSVQIALAIDNARLFEKVQELSNYDELTKLSLRRFFNENLSQEIYRSKRFNLTLSLILMDIDYFKTINDTYGHLLGDEALKEVSNVILSSLRQTDLPCRYGGDEIVIMLPRTTGEEAKNIAKRLSKKVSEIKLNPKYTGGREIKLSISQGIAVFPYDTQEQAELFKRADDALYHVKQNGRGFWSLYSDIKDVKEDA